MNIAVVIPVWNEEKRIRATLKEFCEYRHTALHFSEIIISDDGSVDHTREQCASGGDSRVRVIGEPAIHHGKGWAVQQGILAVSRSSDWILVADADCSVPVRDLDALLPFSATHDVVIGSRAVHGAVIEFHQPWWREVLGKMGNRLIQLILLRGMRDTQCGFKLYRRDIQKAAQCLRIPGWGYDFELLYLAKKAGMRIAEVPVHWRHSPRTKVRWTAFAETLYDLFAVRWNDMRGYYHF